MRQIKVIYSIAGLLLMLLAFSAKAQLSMSGQIRTRSEYRNGVGNLMPNGSDPSFFTSQRTALVTRFKANRLMLGVQIRDVRVWGQDASTINNIDGNRLFLHEAWGEYSFINSTDTASKVRLDNLSLRVGRQELIYDDARLLGNLDWLQQGRRHDAAILKLMHKGLQVDIGLAYNQNSDAFGRTGVFYNPVNNPAYATTTTGFLIPIPSSKSTFIPTVGKNGTPVVVGASPGTNGMTQMYKSMQFVYLKRKFGQTFVSGLFFKDDFAKWILDSIGNATTGYAYGRNYNQTGVHSRYTFGLNVNTIIGKDNATGVFAVQAFGYYQTGQDLNGYDMNAYYTGATVFYQKKKWSVGPGYELLSGNSKDIAAGTNHRFDPLYGTPHKFWGYMDYFYVGTGSPIGGLQNLYLRTKYTTPKAVLSLDVHEFWIAAGRNDIYTSSSLDKFLGTEMDVVFNYNFSKAFGMEAGYSMMFATSSMEYVKTELTGVPTKNATRHNASWAYLMLNFKPDFL